MFVPLGWPSKPLAERELNALSDPNRPRPIPAGAATGMGRVPLAPLCVLWRALGACGKGAARWKDASPPENKHRSQADAAIRLTWRMVLASAVLTAGLAVVARVRPPVGASLGGGPPLSTARAARYGARHVGRPEYR